MDVLKLLKSGDQKYSDPSPYGECSLLTFVYQSALWHWASICSKHYRKASEVAIKLALMNSVTRSGDLLVFGQLFEAIGNNSFAQISQHS